MRWGWEVGARRVSAEIGAVRRWHTFEGLCELAEPLFLPCCDVWKAGKDRKIILMDSPFFPSFLSFCHIIHVFPVGGKESCHSIVLEQTLVFTVCCAIDPEQRPSTNSLVS